MNYNFSFRYKPLKALFLILAATMAISGCVTMMEPRARYITSATNDSCARHREPFVQILEAQRREMAKWAKIGAAVGVTAGLASARNRSSNDKIARALIGAIGGALAGATYGYYADLQQRTKSTKSLRNSVFRDARKDVRSSDRLVNGVIRLNKCRLTKLNAIARGVQKGTITKKEARAQLAAVKYATKEDNALIAGVTSGLRKRTNFYVTALQKSGANNADAYIARAKAYKPIVRKPKFTVRRGSVKPIGISRRSKRGENSVVGTAKNAAELSALQTAHLEAVDDGIKDINALLL